MKAVKIAGALMLFAGLWAWWKGRQGAAIDALRVDTTQRQEADYGIDYTTGTAVDDFVFRAYVGLGAEKRGLRNNNPGNIEHDHQAWVGLATPATDGRFCRFIAPEYGLRAMYRILMTYRGRGGDTIRKIIETWAPPFKKDKNGNLVRENDTEGYIRNVVAWTGIQADRRINGNAEYIKVMRAMVRMENGIDPYSERQYALALEFAAEEKLTQAQLAKINAVAV